jgi:ubiquitin C-terminal hydrolase
MIEQETILMQMDDLHDILEKQNHSRTNIAHLTEEEIGRWEAAIEGIGN